MYDTLESRPGIGGHGVGASRARKNQVRTAPRSWRVELFALRNICSCRAGYSSFVVTFQKTFPPYPDVSLDEISMQAHSLLLRYLGVAEGLLCSAIEPQMRTDYLVLIVYPAPRDAPSWPVEVLYPSSRPTLTESHS